MVLKQYDVTPNMGKVHIHEISYRFIAHLIGQLLAFESMLLCVCCCMSMIYGESDLMSFIVSFVISHRLFCSLMSEEAVPKIRSILN